MKQPVSRPSYVQCGTCGKFGEDVDKDYGAGGTIDLCDRCFTRYLPLLVFLDDPNVKLTVRA